MSLKAFFKWIFNKKNLLKRNLQKGNKKTSKGGMAPAGCVLDSSPLFDLFLLNALK